MEKVFNEEGKVAVLVSPGYGAGWSTWAHNHGIAAQALFDSEVVQWVLDGKPEEKFTDDPHEYFREKYGGYIYCGGLTKLEIEWVTPGRQFRIAEYDGYESLEFNDEVKWVVA